MPKYEMFTTAEVPTLDELRSYTGISSALIVSSPTDGGMFLYDQTDRTSSDDSENTVVDYKGRRWKRFNSDKFSFIQAGTGAKARIAQSKLRDIVCVFDFMTAAQIADVQANTALVDVSQALIDAKASGKSLYFPAGTYLTAPITFTASCWGEGAEKTILKAKSGSTGFLVSLQSTSGQFALKFSGFGLTANGSGQSGLRFISSTAMAEGLKLLNFDTFGISFGDGTTGAYWCRAAECFVTMAGGTGVRFASGTVNANANECQNVYVCGTFTTGLDMQGRGNEFTGGTIEWQTGVVDVIKIDGSYNNVDRPYIEAVSGAQPTKLLNISGNNNNVDLLLQASLSSSLYSKITDTGRGNNIEIPQNLRFVSVRNRSQNNLWPNSRFKLWKGANQPFGYTNIGAGATKDSSITYMGNPTLKMTISGNSLVANCYMLLGGNSDVDYPLEAFQGKTVSIAVACKTTLVGYGGLTYTIVAPSGNVNGAANASHTGGGGWEIFTTSFRVPDDATSLFCSLRSHESNTVGTGDIWFGAPTLVFGSDALNPANVVTPDDEVFRTEDIIMPRDGSVEGDSPLLVLHNSRHLWADNLGAIRTSDSRPTDLETSGNPLGRKVSVPATATTAGVPGDWAADTSNFYVYTGDGSTHTWRRVAVAAW